MALIVTNYSKFTIDEVQGADAQTEFTLQEYFDTVSRSTFVRVTVLVKRFTSSTGAPIGGDINTIGFDVLDNRTSVNITNVVDINPTTGAISPIQSSTLTNFNLGGSDRFEFGLQVGSGGSNDVTLNSLVRFDVNNITLSQFVGQRFGTRLQSQGGGSNSSSSRLVGTASNSSIGDLVWKDDSGDGVFQPNEGIDGVTIFLKDSDGNILATAVTGDNPITTSVVEKGFYNFIGLGKGIFTIDVDQTSAPLAGLVLQSGTYPTSVTLPDFPTTLSNVDFQYRSQQGTLSAVIKDIVGGAMRGADANNDTVPDDFFIVPTPGQTFTQQVTISSAGGTSAPREILIKTTNDPFVRLDSVSGIEDGKAGDLDGAINGQVRLAIPAISPTSPLILNVVSRIVNADSSLTPATLTFNLQDSAGTNDYGAATGKIDFFFTQQNFQKQIPPSVPWPEGISRSSPTVAYFKPFAPNVIEVDLNPVDVAVNASLTTPVVTGVGTLTEGEGGQSKNTVHNLFLNDYAIDVDPLGGGGIRIYSTPQTGNLLAVWKTSLDTTTYAQSSGSEAFDEFIKLVNNGNFAQINATSSFTKNGKTVDSQFNTSNSKQTLLAGNLVNSANPVVLKQFPNDASPGQTFQQFVNSLPVIVNGLPVSYTIEITTSSVLPISWSNYSATTQARIPIIKLPTGTSTLAINNGFTQDVLNLSTVRIVDANGNLVGVNISGNPPNTGNSNTDTIIGSPGNDNIRGTNGGDRLNGWLGDDILFGGNGPDVFVFSKPTSPPVNSGQTFGNDTITDFSPSDRIDLSAFGLRFNQIRQSVQGSGSSRFLLIDLTRTTNNTLIPWGGTIRLDGVTSALGSTSFIGLVQ